MRSGSTGSPAASSSCRRHDGFSLIEVLAALVVLAIGLGTLFPAFSNAVGAAGRADGRLAAVQLAQSLLDQQTAGRLFKPGATSGRQGQFAWTVEIEPADEVLAPAVPAGAWQLQRLAVTVTWPRQRQFRLETLHLAKLQ